MAREDSNHTRFAMVPYLVDDLKLSAAAVRLYLHLTRRAGEGGTCNESQDNIARHCKMHKQTIVRAKKELEKAGLIKVKIEKLPSMKHPGHVIRVIDIWDRNTEFYEKGGLKGIPQSKTDTALNSPKEIPQSGENGYRKGGENVPSKKNPLKKNLEGDIPAKAGSALSKKSLRAQIIAQTIAEIIARMQISMGYPETLKQDPIHNPAKEAKFIKRIIDRGFTEDLMFETWQAKVKERGEFVSMYYVNEDIGKSHAKARFPGYDRIYTEPPEDDDQD